MQSGGQTLFSLNSLNESLLVVEDRLQPQLAHENVARCEAMIKRSLRGSNAFNHRINGDGSGAAPGSESAGGCDEIASIEQCFSHGYRLLRLDCLVDMQYPL